MPFELEALVGHLYMVGGRVIKTQPPGALVEVAPGKASRGREADTFFALVLPSGSSAPSTFYEQMALMSAERFFATGGSVTSALREMLNTLNNNLYEHNQSGRTHYEANLICAVLRDDELYLARVGAAVAVLRHSGTTLTYPEDLTVDEHLYQPPLGVQPIPQVQMKRFLVDSGTRLLLADASLAEIKADNLTQALVAGDLEQVLADLKLLITGQVQLVATELVPAEAPVSVPVVTGESTGAIAAQMAAQRSQAAASAATPAPAPRRPPRTSVVQRTAGRLIRPVGGALLALGEVAGKLFTRPIDSPRPRLSSGFLMGAVIGFPALIVLIVVLSWAARVGETEFEGCVAQAVEAATFARSMDSSNPPGVIAAWQGTLTRTAECLALRPTDELLLNIRAEGRSVLDRVNVIDRRNTHLIATFENARIKTLVLQGLNLYALDDASDLVYRVQIGSDGLSAAGTPQFIVNMRRGATVDGLPVGDLFDIAYDDQEDRIAALDTAGVLVRCLPQFLTRCDGQRILASETWRSPTRISIWQGRLYLLDPQGNQLWRYQATGGQYPGNPTEYFAGEVRPNLINAIDFDITTTGIGTVYVLYSDALMSQHLAGEAQPFAFSAFPDDTFSQSSTNSLFLNDGPIDASLYIVSQSTRTVYKTTLSGTFIARYQVFDEDDFALLSDVVVDPSTQIIYAASGNAIFAVKMTDG
ncbi:MAG: hypothetical protein MUE40_11865 [Anaerolineae bacterium]|nr:hypothetical protein [Anaerolineae bacterium]